MSFENNYEQDHGTIRSEDIDSLNDFDELRRLAFQNSKIGSIYNQARFKHLHSVIPDYMTRYQNMNENGYLVDAEGNADIHVTQVDDLPSEEEFFEKMKNDLKEKLQEN